MAVKNYANAGSLVNISDSSDDIMDYIERLNQARISNQANARAERMALLQEAQVKYNNKVTQQRENQANALNQWSTYGLDFGTAAGEDMNAAFASRLPDLSEQWEGYVSASKSNGVIPDFMNFNKQVMGQNAAYMNTIIGRFNVLTDEYRRNNPNASASSIMKYMRDNHNADQVYENYARVAAMGGGQLMTQMDYVPPTKDEPWYKDALAMVWEPGIEGQGGGIAEGPAKPIAGAAIAGKVYDHYNMKNLSSSILEDAKKFSATYGKNKSGDFNMKGEDFKAKYGITKKDFGDGTTDKAKKAIKRLARQESTFGKASQKLIEKGQGKWGSRGRRFLPYAIGATGGMELAEAVGLDGAIGQVGGAAAGGIAFNKAMKKLASPEGSKKILSILNKTGYGKSLAKKIGLSTAGLLLPEGVSSALGAAGLAWSAYDLMKLAEELPELYDYLSGD